MMTAQYRALLPKYQLRMSSSQACEWLEKSKSRLKQCVAGLSEEQLTPPWSPTVNPIHWEAAHVAFFFDHFIRQRYFGRDLLFQGAEEMFHSIEVPHKERWNMHLPSMERVMEYLDAVTSDIAGGLTDPEVEDRLAYLIQLGVMHQDMHCEAFLMTRQTLEYPSPVSGETTGFIHEDDQLTNSWVTIPKGTYWLGARPESGFVFDNEKWGQENQLNDFQIRKYPVLNSEFLKFVEAGGYETKDFWSYGGRLWLRDTGSTHPRDWRIQNNSWQQRHYDRWFELDGNAPVSGVSWYEAEAYCRFVQGRLPTEAEWEAAASMVCPDSKTTWDGPWRPDAAHLESWYPSGFNRKKESTNFCEGLIGHVWEWTIDNFFPFKGYEVDFPYKEYSTTSFGYHKVLKGGSFATSSRMIRKTWRNFYLPHRQDVFAGFRVVQS